MSSRGSSIKDEEIWGDDEDMSHQNWSKMDEEYTNAGYREGITAGKEAALQEGFDDGFASVGAPLGRTVGQLRGVANGLKNFLSTNDANEDKVQCRAEIIKIVEMLGKLRLADLAPPDIEAEAHAREHLEEASEEHFEHVSLPNALHEARERPAIEELKQLQEQISVILKEFGIDLPANSLLKSLELFPPT